MLPLLVLHLDLCVCVCLCVCEALRSWESVDDLITARNCSETSPLCTMTRELGHTLLTVHQHKHTHTHTHRQGSAKNLTLFVISHKETHMSVPGV